LKKNVGRGITINTDASFCQQTKVGAYAFYIVCDLFRIKKAGVFKQNPANPMDAEMKTHLHKLPEGFILTSDEEIKNGDTVLEDLSGIFAPYEEGDYVINPKKVVAEQDQLVLSSMPEKDQKEIGWFDVDKLAINQWGNVHRTGVLGYKEGFQKAQQLLSDKQFTLEDMENALMAYSQAIEKQEHFFISEYTKSLTKTSSEVEVEMEKVNNKPGASYSFKTIYRPKFVDGKIKVLNIKS